MCSGCCFCFWQGLTYNPLPHCSLLCDEICVLRFWLLRIEFIEIHEISHKNLWDGLRTIWLWQVTSCTVYPPIKGRLTAVLHHSLSTDRCETGTASFPISPCAHSASEKITSSHSRLSFPAAFWGTVLVLYFWNTHHWPAVWLQRNLARIVFNFPIPRTRESIKKESHEGPGKVA